MNRPSVPCDAGTCLKAEHYHDIIDNEPDVGWFEVHPENYMGAGGPPHGYLTRIRDRYPLSLHGVGLSIGGSLPLDAAHLDRLRALVSRYEPGLVSEHLAWSTHQAGFLNDLLAVPYTPETLARVCDHVDQVQSHLDRTILLENPSTYILFEDSSIDEIDFLTAVVRRTGCGLLLDVNNVYVSCTNHGLNPVAYIDRFPLSLVGEIHLAGHAERRDRDGGRLLIDAHDRAVADPVWHLYERALGRGGPAPTLIEWDNTLPDWPTLHGEALIARSLLRRAQPAEARHVA